MQGISALEFRTNLKEISGRVRAGENICLRFHGKDTIGIVGLDWLNVADQSDIVDTISQDGDSGLQEKIREIKLGVIRYYAEQLVNSPQILTVSEVIMLITSDVSELVKGEILKRKIGMS